jgi:glycosyltransferase involved in cell wall biosynthesis
MKILHIISNMNPSSGGPQEAVRMMLRSAPVGSTSEVVTLDDPASSFLHNEPSTIHALGNWKRLTPWLRANRNRFDGIVLHGMWQSLSFSVLRAIAGHKPYIVYAHGMLDPYFKRAFPLKHLKKWLYWLPVQYWVMRRALRVVFTTEAERDLATQSFSLHRWNSAVIALGADLPPADLDCCKEAFFKKWSGLREKQFLLFLGRIDPKKGCDLLQSAFAKMAREHPHLNLVIAGPDHKGWKAKLEVEYFDSYAEGRVWWPGMLTGEAKWGALAAADAFILPSHQENFGIAIVEALACGTPALLTHPINIAADLAHDGSAFVEPDTLEGTQRLITRWLALTSEQRAAMRTNARNSVATRYDMRKNTQALFDLFSANTNETPYA